MRHSSLLLLLGVCQISLVTLAARADEEATKPLTESQIYSQIQNELNQQNMEAAEELFADALKQFPESERFHPLHFTFYALYTRERNYDDGLQHLTVLVDGDLERIRKTPLLATRLANYTNNLYLALRRQDRSNDAFAKLDEVIAGVATARESDQTGQVAGAYSILIGRKATAIASERPDEALKLTADDVKDAVEAFEAGSSDMALFQRLANARYNQLRVTAMARPAALPELRDEHLAFVSDHIKSSPDNSQVVSAFYSAHLFAISSVYRSDPEYAERLVASAKATLESLDSRNASIKSIVAGSQRSFRSYKLRIASAKKQNALIGTLAPPLNADAWLNGSPLADDDLKGKVVLLDFWAVWCGPCIATFPHLTEWTEKFADKGLVVVGATRYYKDDWDDEAKKRVRKKELSPEAERAATMKFAAHHGLKHRLFYISRDNKLNAHYVVTSIPTAVLIDRSGKVRFIKVGASSAGAQELEQKIEELLAENVE